MNTKVFFASTLALAAAVALGIAIDSQFLRLLGMLITGGH